MYRRHCSAWSSTSTDWQLTTDAATVPWAMSCDDVTQTGRSMRDIPGATSKILDQSAVICTTFRYTCSGSHVIRLCTCMNRAQQFQEGWFTVGNGPLWTIITVSELWCCLNSNVNSIELGCKFDWFNVLSESSTCTESWFVVQLFSDCDDVWCFTAHNNTAIISFNLSRWRCSQNRFAISLGI